MEMYQQRKILTETSLESVLDNAELINSADNTIDDYVSDEVHAPKANRPEPCLAVSASYMDFGASRIVGADAQSNERSVIVFNNTKGKLLVYWNSVNGSPFSVSPQECEIPPMKSYSFRIKFQPQFADKFYECRLECTGMYKSLSNYSLIDERFALPSWTAHVTCIGHTFHPGCETFNLPRYTLDSENIVFPVSIRDRPIFRTLTLKNTVGDYPLVFDLQSPNNE
jgi:hypothetical protein